MRAPKNEGKTVETVDQRSFVVETDREIPENSSLRVIQKVETQNGKSCYKVVAERPEDHWY